MERKEKRAVGIMGEGGAGRRGEEETFDKERKGCGGGGTQGGID